MDSGISKARNLDQQIISLLREKNTRGIDLLYDNYANATFNVVFKIVNTEDLSRTVLQDTFLKVWRKIDFYNQDKGRFATWVLNIAKNTAVDMVRSKYYRENMQLTNLERIAARPPIIEIKIEDIGVKEIVKKLDAKYHVLIELIFFNGFTYAEAAEYLNIPLGTLKSRVRKAFSELRVLLDDKETTRF